jgi:hypothetical protein
MDLKRVRFHTRVWPHRAHELFFCDESASRSDQNFEAVEGSNAESDDDPVGSKLATVQVDLQPPTYVGRRLVF